jgi:hypothetical protein
LENTYCEPPDGPSCAGVLDLEKFNMATYAGEALLLKKSAAVFLLLLGIVLIVVGLSEQSSPVITIGSLSLLGGVLLLVFKIFWRNQGNRT